MRITREKAIEIRRKIEKAAQSQTDEDALQSIDLFPRWEAKLAEGKAVPVGLRLQFRDTLYEVIQAHTPQAGWTPDITPALFKVVSVEEWPEIPENIPSTSPWMKGQKGTWKGEHYISKIDNNVWNPDVYPAGWEKA